MIKINVLAFSFFFFLVHTYAQSPANGITVAGGHSRGSSPDQLNNPAGICVDNMGNLYVTDRDNHRVQKWAPGASTGITVAGGNGPGSANNQLYFPFDVFVDSIGNLYVADANNSRIQKWPPGASEGITVVSGQQLGFPWSFYIDNFGYIYVCDYANNRIQRFAPGETTAITVAGGHGAGSAANQLANPQGVFVDALRDIYVADVSNNRIQKWGLFDQQGPGKTVAGGGLKGSADYELAFPYDVFVDASGNIFIADHGNARIQKWAPGAQKGVTVAGGNGVGSAANQLGSAWSVCVGKSGDIYVSDPVNQRVQRFPAGGTKGLRYEVYFSLNNLDTLPDFSQLPPSGNAGFSTNIDISVRPQGVEDNFAIIWEGYINIATPGIYTFSTASDDGSRIYFNTKYSAGAIPLVDNNGVHPNLTVSGTVNVTTPGAYPITVAYFNKTGDKNLSVFWKGPGFDMQPIPNAAFIQPVNDTIPPVTPMNLQAASVGSSFVNLEWNDAMDNFDVAGYEVYVNGVKKYNTTTTAISIGNLVPGTAYTFSVLAYDISGNKSALSASISKSTGTEATHALSYRVYEGNWKMLPDFNAQAPVKAGYSSNIDMGVRPAGVNDHFAVVWEGYINIPAAGNYTFETISDDGSKLYFNSLYSPDANALVNNDSIHPLLSATATVNIPAAGSYPVAITYFENEGEENMRIYWTGPGIERQLIPDTAFVRNRVPSTGGLTYKYYEGDFDTLPDFTSLTPLKTGSTSNVDIGVRPQGVNDHFAFVWEGYVNIPRDGSYTFETISDDGSKLFFNSMYSPYGNPLINNDGVHAPWPRTATVTITAGRYPIAVAYFEKDGGQNMELYWSGPGIERQRIPDAAFGIGDSLPSGGLNYKYFEGDFTSLPDFKALSPVKTGKTPNIDIDIRPAGVNDHFAFMWEGYITIPVGGTYTFETISDDGSKLYFNSMYSPNEAALINSDGVHAPLSATGTVTIAAGRYPIAIAYFEKEGGETMQLYWTGPGIERQRIPDAAFSTDSPASLFTRLDKAAVSYPNKAQTSRANDIPHTGTIYPNPFIDGFVIDFYNSEAGNDIDVLVYDSRGRMVHRYQAGKFPVGRTTLKIYPGNRMEAGVYVVRLQMNGVPLKTLKLVKAKI